MAHFARVDDDNIVREVLVVSNDAIEHKAFPESEPLGRAVLQDSGINGAFYQCSYSSSFRGCYPGNGYTYDPIADEFVPPSETADT